MWRSAQNDGSGQFQPCASAQTRPTPNLTLITRTPTLWGARGRHAAGRGSPAMHSSLMNFTCTSEKPCTYFTCVRVRVVHARCCNRGNTRYRVRFPFVLHTSYQDQITSVNMRAYTTPSPTMITVSYSNTQMQMVIMCWESIVGCSLFSVGAFVISNQNRRCP